MKWLLFTSASVVVLIALGLLAVDERDVVWEGRKALCGYCRAELPYHAVVCRECDRSLDWRTNKEECGWCLDRKDVDHLRDVYRELVASGPLPTSLEAYGPYFDAIEVGQCTYCGGIGKVMNGGEEVVCPVCRGDKRCIACGGSRSVVIGDEGAHRRALEREDARSRARERATVADLPVNVEMLVDGDVAALRGYAEAEGLRDSAGRKLLEEMAHGRLKAAFRALHEEHDRRAKERGGP
jgi:ribosomal protein L40E